MNRGGPRWLAVLFSPVYRGFRATHLGAHRLPAAFPGHAPYADDALGPCLALVAQTAVMLGVTWLFLRRKGA